MEKVKNTSFDNNSHKAHDLKRPQRTSNDFKRPQSTSKTKKNDLKGGSTHDNIEINEHYLDKILNNIKL